MLVLLNRVGGPANLVAATANHEGDPVHRIVEVATSRTFRAPCVDEGWVVCNDPLRRGSLPEDGVGSSGVSDSQVGLLREPIVEVPGGVRHPVASFLQRGALLQHRGDEGPEDASDDLSGLLLGKSWRCRCCCQKRKSDNRCQCLHLLPHRLLRRCRACRDTLLPSLP